MGELEYNEMVFPRLRLEVTCINYKRMINCILPFFLLSVSLQSNPVIILDYWCIKCLSNPQLLGIPGKTS